MAQTPILEHQEAPATIMPMASSRIQGPGGAGGVNLGVLGPWETVKAIDLDQSSDVGRRGLRAEPENAFFLCHLFPIQSSPTLLFLQGCLP